MNIVSLLLLSSVKKYQNVLRWPGQNANQKVGPDKMPTTGKKSRTKCQPRLAFCPVGILSGWHFVHTPVPPLNGQNPLSSF